jgi:cytochrome c oxidase cbb3-type subunit 3
VDGIREFDNALPRWWLYGFYFTIAFAAVYLVNYHMLAKPLFGAPILAAEYAADVERAGRRSQPSGDHEHGPALAGVVAFTDRDSLEKGRAIFEGPDNTCFACHRADLGGLVGPNLTDHRWLHGCTAGDLVRDVKGGFPQKGMLPFGTGKVLTDDQVLQVVSYVLSKQGSNPPNPKPIDPERDTECGP